MLRWLVYKINQGTDRVDSQCPMTSGLFILSKLDTHQLNKIGQLGAV